MRTLITGGTNGMGKGVARALGMLKGRIHGDDLQLQNQWDYEKAIDQGMKAKWMIYYALHRYYPTKEVKINFAGFQIHKTVWSNQISYIPGCMRFMAGIVKFFGGFISIDQYGEIVAPLFLADNESSGRRSGKFITWKNNQLTVLDDSRDSLNPGLQDRLWEESLALGHHEPTSHAAKKTGLKSYPSMLVHSWIFR
jgi:hypothetical protein